MTTSSHLAPADGAIDPKAVVAPHDTTARYLPAGTPVAISPGDATTLRDLGLPSSTTVYNLIATGQLAAYKIGKASFVLTADIVDCIRREPMPPLRRAHLRLTPA
jgi:hypothetical protein